MDGVCALPADPGVPSFSLKLDSASVAAAGGSVIGTVGWTTGRDGVGAAAKFGGVGAPGAIRIPNSAALVFNGGGTIDLWARIDSTTGMDGYGRTVTAGAVMALWAKSHDSNGVALVAYSPDPSLPGTGYGYAGLAAFDATWRGCTAASTLTRNPGNALGSWFRMTTTMSATAGTAIYVNKTLIVDCPAVRPSFARMNGQDLVLGKYSDSWYPLNGALQDLRIFPKALTAAEVAALP